MVPRCLRLWLIPVAVWAAALPFAFGQQNGAVFLKDGDHLALAPVTFGASGFTLEAWLFVVDSSDSTVLDFGGGFFHPRVALQLRDGGKAELVVDNRPLAEQRGVLRTTEAFAKVSSHLLWASSPPELGSQPSYCRFRGARARGCAQRQAVVTVPLPERGGLGRAHGAGKPAIAHQPTYQRARGQDGPRRSVKRAAQRAGCGAGQIVSLQNDGSQPQGRELMGCQLPRAPWHLSGHQVLGWPCPSRPLSDVEPSLAHLDPPNSPGERSRRSQNRWMHLAAVFNASSGLAAIYWDGRLRAEGPMPVPLQYQRPEAYVGRSTQVGAPLTGLVDDVRVWSVARSRADLLDGVFKSLSGPIGGLLFSLSLDEVSIPA